METEAPRPARGLLVRLFWTLLAVVLIGYPLSFGPIVYWKDLNDPESFPPWFETYFQPIGWLSEHATWAIPPFLEYINASSLLARKHRAARERAAPATLSPAAVP